MHHGEQLEIPVVIDGGANEGGLVSAIHIWQPQSTTTTKETPQASSIDRKWYSGASTLAKHWDLRLEDSQFTRSLLLLRVYPASFTASPSFEPQISTKTYRLLLKLNKIHHQPPMSNIDSDSFVDIPSSLDFGSDISKDATKTAVVSPSTTHGESEKASRSASLYLPLQIDSPTARSRGASVCIVGESCMPDESMGRQTPQTNSRGVLSGDANLVVPVVWYGTSFPGGFWVILHVAGAM
ncbi:hypothetical protein DEU56DRAFT_761005 [Suillus clintonianus]|uniref:uncharacterized protein n=1 Tax=Suillus clintonianus TaxID=1904413 RepID=UPI001B8830DC|nr:uncharacterized protein DEU56DRAFT_761005 [Suillus clintonianus]KAG2119354.1 hypothetical protein DEU56DRAFT_761005 [Suillus clintonianus]